MRCIHDKKQNTTTRKQQPRQVCQTSTTRFYKVFIRVCLRAKTFRTIAFKPTHLPCSFNPVAGITFESPTCLLLRSLGSFRCGSQIQILNVLLSCRVCSSFSRGSWFFLSWHWAYFLVVVKTRPLLGSGLGVGVSASVLGECS